MPTRAKAMVRMERISEEVSSFKAATMITLKGSFTVTGSRVAGPTSFEDEAEEIRVAAGMGGISVCTCTVEEEVDDEPKLMEDFPPGGA